MAGYYRLTLLRSYGFEGGFSCGWWWKWLTADAFVLRHLGLGVRWQIFERRALIFFGTLLTPNSNYGGTNVFARVSMLVCFLADAVLAFRLEKYFVSGTYCCLF
jgi:hypothetical protein